MDSNALIAELRTRIASVWTDVADNSGGVIRGIHEAEDLEAIPFDNITPPYAVILCHEGAKFPSRMTGKVWMYSFDIYYVRAKTATQPALRTKIEALVTSLLTTDLTNGQVWEVTRASWSRNLEINRAFIDRNIALRAGLLSMDIRTED